MPKPAKSPEPRSKAKKAAPSGALLAVSAPVRDESRQQRNLALQILFIVLSSVAVFGFVYSARNDQQRADCSATCALTPAYAGRNRLAPDFTLPNIDGGSLSLQSLRGKTVVMNFWASWCEPCRNEMPSIARLAMSLEGRKDVALVTISVDEEVGPIRDTLATLFAADEELKGKLEKGKIPFVVLHDPELTVVRDLYGTTMYPETWLIDKDGFIRARFDGEEDWAGAAALRVIEGVKRGTGCLADFENKKPVGRFARLCDRE